MKINTWLLLWLALGGYYVVATIGLSLWAAPLTLFCGYMAGRSVGDWKPTSEREAGE